MSTVLPYKNKETGKKEQVAEMFNNISPKYDFLNHFLSFGIDILWRKKAVKILKNYHPATILDIATGTADFAIEALAVKPKKIIGIDISQGMLDFGIAKLKKRGLDKIISLELGDSENMRFDSNSFDAVIVSFGVRNFENLKKGLEEIYRVLKKDGVLIVLEFSKPTSFPFKQFYQFYFRYILPTLGKIISKDNSAYTYLPESVNAFPNGKAFTDLLDELNYKKTKCKTLTLGVSSIYIGEK